MEPRTKNKAFLSAYRKGMVAALNEEPKTKNPFEIRNNDRGFIEGDILTLMEYDPDTKEYSGKVTMVLVTKVWKTLPGMQLGYVAMEIDVLHSNQWKVV